MQQEHDIRLPQDSLARALTPHEIEQVAGGEDEFTTVKPNTSSLTTGCNPPIQDMDYD